MGVFSECIDPYNFYAEYLELDLCKSLIPADTMDVMDPHEMDLASIVWTVATYLVADFNDLLPRSGEYPVKKSSPILKTEEFNVKNVNIDKTSSHVSSSSSSGSGFTSF